MKKIILCLLLVLSVAVALIACNDTNPPSVDTEGVTADAPTTEAEITEIETDAPDSTEPPTTDAVTTAPVTTDVITTEAATTAAVTTEEATTEAVTTSAPSGGGGGGAVPPGGGGGAVPPATTTEAQTTEPPTTESPTTEPPTTDAPDTTSSPDSDEIDGSIFENDNDASYPDSWNPIGQEDVKIFENDNDASYPDSWNPKEEEKKLETFVTSTHDTSLTQLGQDIYSTGANYTATASMSIDGTINSNEGWVCVTPTDVTKTLASTYMGAGSNSGYTQSAAITPNPTLETNNPNLMPDVKYYVASSADTIYLAVKIIRPAETIGGWVGQVRLGFNPNDYRQQLIAYTDGPSKALSVSSMADNSGVISLGTTSVVSASVANDGVYEIAFSKAQLIAAYSTVFKTTLTNADLDTMFIGISLRIRTNDSDVARPYYGTLLSSSAASAAGENTVIPDVIVFGAEKNTNSSAFASCSFEGHSIEQRYAVAGQANSYYHACTHCGMAGASTFKYVDGEIICDC